MSALRRYILLAGGLAFCPAPASSMPVRGAYSAGATRHPIYLPRRRPQRGPKEEEGQQTHPGAKVSSRSDRNVERLFHGRVGKLYINLRLLSKRCREAHSNLPLARGSVPRRIVRHPHSVRPWASATLSWARSPSILRRLLLHPSSLMEDDERKPRRSSVVGALAGSKRAEFKMKAISEET
jgi:hypothetical protein